MNQSLATPLFQRLAFVNQVWLSRSAREQRVLKLAVALLLLTGVWLWAIAPAWTIWKAAPEKTAGLQAELQTVQALALQAQALQGLPRMPVEQQRQALANLTQQNLGTSARLTVQEGRTLVALEAVPAEQLAAWLAAVREGAQWQPSQARLRHPPTAMSTSQNEAASTTAAAWSGEVVFEHPR